jgi:hypothetical protein
LLPPVKAYAVPNNEPRMPMASCSANDVSPAPSNGLNRWLCERFKRSWVGALTGFN